MKPPVPLVSFVILLILRFEVTGAKDPDPRTNNDPGDFIFNSIYNNMNIDNVTGKRYFMAIKFNTIQVLYSEAQFSLEFFGKRHLSSQIQAGIIFPMRPGFFLKQFFESYGPNATATDKGIFSYRNSPFNNHGISLKYELRRFGNEFYYAPQLMYKRVWYDEEIFNIWQGSNVIKQTESKSSGIFGIGLMIGKQVCYRRQITDWYGGIGIRIRNTRATVLEISDPCYPGSSCYPGNQESHLSVYPVINLGFKIGAAI
jgi:hypothetical protein